MEAINCTTTSYNKLSESMIINLKKPLPSEAIAPHPTKPYLSTIKAIYVVERLNDVFGLGKWFIENRVVSASEKMIVMESILTVPEYGIRISSFGGNDNADRGDAYKGACTDALTKIASYMYIGMDVYKGLAKQSTNYTSQKSPDNTPMKPMDVSFK